MCSNPPNVRNDPLRDWTSFIEQVCVEDVTYDDLNRLGIRAKKLKFKITEIQDFFREQYNESMISSGMDGFCDQLKKIYSVFSVAGSSRVLVDNFLCYPIDLLYDTTPNSSSVNDKVLVPETELKNPENGYNLFISEDVSHIVLQCQPPDEERLPGDPMLHQCMQTAIPGKIYLLRRAYPDSERPNLSDHIPGAVAQALAVAQRYRLDTLRFCVTTGNAWIYLVLRQDQGHTTYYVSDEYSPSSVYWDYTSGKATWEEFKRCVSDVSFRLIIWWMGLDEGNLYTLE
ncbi:hypothetical protein NP233_g12272 [Leucocoprinus birnbaumii]|uniref:Uncharacterized protein n=1 Tax=Leucocoprinus birnbaumii TaxID=56174 RepID=A0AAD5VEQ3_9AGAR|nr:hypothetical protein NP233_g12272 [Leucocoprinus birnbaumii]